MWGDIISREANRHGLDPRLVAALIVVESAGDPKARRYEVGFFEKYINGRSKWDLKGAFPVNRTATTEMRDRAYSWGLMQMMGQVVREGGYRGDMVDLLDPETNITLGCEHLGVLFQKHGYKYRETFLAWNGGGDETYPDRVFNAIDTEPARRIMKTAGDK